MGKLRNVKSTKTGCMRKYSLETIAEVYATGASANEVGRLLGLHHTTVLYALGQLGIKARHCPGGRHRDTTKTKDGSITARRIARIERNKRIIELYMGGMSADEVGNVENMCGSSILKVLVKNGIPRRQKGRPMGIKTRPAVDGPVGHRDFSAYREQWRAERGMGPVERMMRIVSRRKDWAA